MIDGANGQNSTSDDEFDRLVRSLTDGTAGEARYRELSHADREKQARRQARSRRRDGRNRGTGIGRRVKQAGIRVTTAVLVVGLAAGAWYALREFKGTGRPASALPAALSPAAPQTSSPALQGPPADPFAGKPPDSWADGAAGIVPPVARPVGSYSKATVAAAYATVRKLLIEGELSKPVLLGGRTAAFTALLPSAARKQFLDGLKAAVSYKGANKNTRDWVTEFVPGSTQLIGSVIKVHGQMTAAVAVKSGYKGLDVRVNYLFAYAIEPPGQPAKWVRLVEHRTGDYLFGHWDGSASPLGPWPLSGSSATPILCGYTDGYVHPDYTQSGGGKGAPIDPYSLKNEGKPGVCGNALPT